MSSQESICKNSRAAALTQPRPPPAAASKTFGPQTGTFRETSRCFNMVAFEQTDCLAFSVAARLRIKIFEGSSQFQQFGAGCQLNCEVARNAHAFVE